MANKYPTSEKRDLYAEITNKIIASLEKGVKPWHKPWAAEGCTARPLRHCGIPYSGINTLVLWMSSENNGYSSPYWMTYQQATEYKGQVRKGEKGTLVVYANKIIKTETNSKGEEETNVIPFLKSYVVFNADQIDGLPAKFYNRPAPRDPIERQAAADAFFAPIPADVRHAGGRAYYSPSLDFVKLPLFESFDNPENYYTTLAHELSHWTKHDSRLNRDFGRKRWGDEGYAAEELVAELSAAFIAADLGFLEVTYDGHASYIDSWIKALKNDKRAIFTASSYASKATEYLSAFSQANQQAIAAE